jgi:N-acetylmuramic acid 6-phosphate (MurNAc-6-P) etherase
MDSEMPDTFGVPHDYVRAFIDGGWASMANAKGDMTSESPLFHVSLAEFEKEILSSLTGMI